MRRIAGSAVLTLFLLIGPIQAYAEDQHETLSEIVAIANIICTSVSVKSQSEELQLSGDARIQLNKRLSKLVALGISGAANFKLTNTEGVLQKDLAGLLSKNIDCRKEMAGKLIDKLLISPSVERSAIDVKGRTQAQNIQMAESQQQCSPDSFAVTKPGYFGAVNDNVYADMEWAIEKGDEHKLSALLNDGSIVRIPARVTACLLDPDLQFNYWHRVRIAVPGILTPYWVAEDALTAVR